MVAEIRSAGFGASQDTNQNLQSDFKDSMEDIRKRSEYREQMDFKREQASVKNSMTKDKLSIEREKLSAQREVADKNLQIARENKNKYDVQSSKKEDKKKNKE